MALDERYIPITSLNQYFVDKDSGDPLANGTLSFFRDTSRATPKTVYELVKVGGEYTYSALPNPINLNAVGTAQNAAGDNVVVYVFPYTNDPSSGELTLDLYYVVCESSGSVLQWTREAVPHLTSRNDPVDEGTGKLNELSNSQFTQYFLIDEVNIFTVSSSNQVFPIAPDWDFIASGSGQVKVTRVPVSGNDAIPTYPAYYLTIDVGVGITNPYLRQRLKYNSGIWSGTYLSGFIVAQISSGSNNLTMKYQDSAGVNSNIDIFDAALTSSWASYGGSVLLDDSSNTQSGVNAYVDIIIELALESIINLTSIQVLSSTAKLYGDVQEYDRRSANRELALMGDYYIPNLEYKNVPSLLIGWDFPKNPRQFGVNSSVSGGTAQYIWDQTILQTSSGLTVNYNKNDKTNGLSLNHQQANKSFALIQYLDNDDAEKFMGTPLSVNINGYTADGASSAQTTDVYVKLFANSSASQFGTLPTTILTLSDDGTMALTATAISNGWYEIPRNNLPTAKGELEVLSSDSDISLISDIKFNNWAVTDNTQVANGIKGICVAASFVPTASTTTYETQIDSISVTPGNIASRPASVSYAQTLYECQHYYEKSYSSGTAEGTVTNSNMILAWLPITPLDNPGSTNNRLLYPNIIEFSFLTEKRSNPSVTIYNPATGNTNSVRVTISNSNSDEAAATNVTFSTYFAVVDISTKQAIYGRNTASSLLTLNAAFDEGLGGGLRLHYAADSRIAI